MLTERRDISDRWVGTVLLAALVCWLLAGCTSVKQTFQGVPADQVWSAMVVVAESPRYDDWHLAENAVWVDGADHRIEVYRRLQRVLYRPDAKPYPQEQAWRFRIDFEPEDDGAAPEAVFVSRGFNIPAYAWAEGDRYFADVRDILAGLGTAGLGTAGPAPDEAAPAPDDMLEPAPEPEPEPEPAEPEPTEPEPAEPEPTEPQPAEPQLQPESPPAPPERALPASSE